MSYIVRHQQIQALGACFEYVVLFGLFSNVGFLFRSFDLVL